MRISSGPSRRNEKPRTASSTCGELIPKSSSTPSTEFGLAYCAIVAKLPWMMVKRGSLICFALVSALKSLSNAMRRAVELSKLSKACEWPPRPNVPSISTALLLNAATASASKTGR